MIDLKPACHRMTDVLAAITEDQLTSPTPCTEYSVGDLVDHVDGVALGFTAIARKTRSERTDTDYSAANLHHDWRDSTARHLTDLGNAWEDPAAWQGTTGTPGVELPNQLWGMIVLTELVVHGWDLAVATGRPFALPAETLRACLDHVAEFVPNAPVAGLWAPAVEVPADAPLLTRVVATTGRNPTF